MPLLRTYSGLVVTLTSLALHWPVIVECRSDSWYPRICTTGMREPANYDDKGQLSFVYGNSVFVPMGNFSDPNGSDAGAESNIEGGRWLRHSTARHLEGAASAAALPWIRVTQQQQSDGNAFNNDLDSPYNLTMVERNSSHNGPPEYWRPCLCHPNQLYQNFYAPNESVPDLYLCPGTAGYCGIPLPGTGPVACFSVTVQEIIAVNAWPIVLLWYLGMILICCCTIHGNTTMDFLRSFCDPQRNRRNVDRILARNTSFQPPPYWNIWAWQNYRFEQNLLAQARMVLRYQDFTREQLRQEQGLPPPSYEMKTKRYCKDSCRMAAAAAEDRHAHDHDDDSVHEPSCTICFVPLEDGDIVGDLACQHVFHKSCLKSWCTRKNACPLCNTTLATRRPDPPSSAAPQDSLGTSITTTATTTTTNTTSISNTTRRNNNNNNNNNDNNDSNNA